MEVVSILMVDIILIGDVEELFKAFAIHDLIDSVYICVLVWVDFVFVFGFDYD
jgi:hypothetical protein